MVALGQEMKTFECVKYEDILNAVYFQLEKRFCGEEGVQGMGLDSGEDTCALHGKAEWRDWSIGKFFLGVTAPFLGASLTCSSRSQ